ncbi:zinc-ribbon domain-containing protein [Pseudoalteromonas rhizosphaerae]|uniref:zinc-ribbon domain-containing protein n=1 Tax=Pseudoalteromonas rhizosphaerae TaxID=2518973 RepID=UPI0012314EF8|nr:zinc-ribbon domain-containing protein [Pseudoalteromonas rhizosphaerae]
MKKDLLIMFCTNCGKENQDSNKFCFNCGLSLKEVITFKASCTSEPKSTHNNFPLVTIPQNKHFNKAVIVFIFLLVIAALAPDKEESEFYSAEDKSRLCRAYIGTVFHKPFTHVSAYNQHGNHTYVEYTRNSDMTNWQYVCNVTDKEIVWAGWQSDLNDWGRWRYEELGKLSYREDENIVIISGKKIDVTRVYLMD